MKKIKMIILLIIMLIPFNVFALDGYYNSVKVETSFASDVDIKSVGSIIIEIKDADNNSYEFELVQENNYTISVKDLFTYSDLSAQVTFEKKVYNSVFNINYDDDMNPVIKINVTNSVNATPAKEEPAYSEEEIAAAQKKVRAKEIRYTIYKLIFGIILGVILGALCIAGIKIVNANK